MKIYENSYEIYFKGSYRCECIDVSYRGNPMVECVKYWCPGSMWGDGVNCHDMPQEMVLSILSTGRHIREIE